MNVGLMLFGMKHDLKQMTTVLAADFSSPVGSLPVERLVAKHIRAFEEMRSLGLTWEQISRLLAGAGILRGNGSAFPASHLRGVYGRQRKRVEEKRPPTGPSGRKLPSPMAPPVLFAPSASIGRPAAATSQHQVCGNNGHPGSQTQEPETNASPHGGVPGAGEETAPVATQEGPADRDRTRVLALMRQAALARRSV